VFTTLNINHGDTARAGLVRDLIASAVSSGLVAHQLMDAAGLSHEQLADPNGFLPVASLERLVCAALAISEDPLLGLHMSERADPAGFGVVGHLRMACSTLQEVIDMTMRYERLVSGFGLTSLSYQPGVVLWCWNCKTDNPLFKRHATEYLLGCWLSTQLRMLPQHPWPILAVYLQHGPPENPALLTEYLRIFGCPVHFNQRVSALVLPAATLKLPLAHPDTSLQQILEQHARQLIAQQELPDTFLERARAQLRILLHQGSASKESLAVALGISSRHLHRQLLREDGKYLTLANELRVELACHYLSNFNESIETVALRLKFSESQSFIRWFKKITGKTPGQYRQSTRKSSSTSP
jgi:AraC-like DNA-binding protein